MTSTESDGDDTVRDATRRSSRAAARGRNHTTTRRRLLAAGASATAATAGLSGCLEGLRDAADDSGFRPDDLPTVENPPDAVYVPSHREGTSMLESTTVGDYEVGGMVSYPHEFWTITEGTTERVTVREEDDVHLMVTVRDAETGAVIPTDAGVTLRVRTDGELVDEDAPWSMLSQGMGFHFGDNVPLDGDGAYEVEVDLPVPGVRTTGAFEGRFESFETATLAFTFDQELRDALIDGIEYVDESQRGVPGALEPGMGGGMDGGEMDGGGEMSGGGEMDGDGAMDANETDDGETGGDATDGNDTDSGERGGNEMDGGEMNGDSMDGQMHGAASTSLPEPSALPGQLQHPAEEPPRSDDADVAVAVVEEFRGHSPYLLVSPRTPYNAYPLPGTSLTATIRRDGSPVVEGRELTATLDSDAGFHYGRAVDDLAPDAGLEPGDDLEVAFGSPPQIARHQGYETAFVETTPIELRVEGW